MPLINCEISFDLNESRCVIATTAVAGLGATFVIIDTKLLCSSCNFINSG